VHWNCWVIGYNGPDAVPTSKSINIHGAYDIISRDSWFSTVGTINRHYDKVDTTS